MRFWTIWTLRGMPLKERINRTLDWLCLLLADWLPKRFAYWIAIRQIGKATMKSENVPATSLDNVLRNIGNIREGKPLEVFEFHMSQMYPEDKHDKHINVSVAPDSPARSMMEQTFQNIDRAQESRRLNRGLNNG